MSAISWKPALDRVEGDAALAICWSCPPRKALFPIPCLQNDPLAEAEGLPSLGSTSCYNYAVLIFYELALFGVQWWKC
jgi:hypothetical protein